VKSRVVGQGATCAGCDDRRLGHLRYWELGGRGHAPGGTWVVLCHNCVAMAEKLEPPPRSSDGLKMRLCRDRRWGDRRAEAVGRPSAWPPALERRVAERRSFDELIESIVVEMEADFEPMTEDQREAPGHITDQITDQITDIHLRIPLPE
jgi:hypothetical protein